MHFEIYMRNLSCLSALFAASSSFLHPLRVTMSHKMVVLSNQVS